MRFTTWGPRLVELLAVIPPLMMLREVLSYTQMHFFDYWWVLLDITNEDGSLRPEALFGFRNEHPFLLPSVLFWLSARYGNGLNQPLGWVVIGFGVGCVLLVRAMLPKDLNRWQRAALVLATSTLVFNPHGIHNFVRSMSGASWVLAMLLVLAALFAMQRRHGLTAVLLGLLASVSYGTSFAVWPALTVVAWMRGYRRRWQITPMAVGIVVVATWLVLRGPRGGGGNSPTSDPAQALLSGLSMLGMQWTGTEPSVALLAGVVGLTLLCLHFPTTAAGRHDSAEWWGLAVYAVGCAVMIAGSRAAFGEDAGLQSRYNSMAAALWIAVLVVVIAWPRWAALRQGAVLGTVVSTVALGAPTAQSIRDDQPNQEMLAVAARAGVPDSFSDRFPQPAELLPRLRALGHYPFSEEFTLGCGDNVEIGNRVDTGAWRTPSVDSYREPQGAPDGRDVLLNVETDQVTGNARMLDGWAISGIERARCVAVLDQTGTVVGGGTVDIPRPDAESKTDGIEIGLGYEAIAPADTTGPLRLAFHFPDGWWIRPLTQNPQVEQ